MRLALFCDKALTGETPLPRNSCYTSDASSNKHQWYKEKPCIEFTLRQTSEKRNPFRKNSSYKSEHLVKWTDARRPEPRPWVRPAEFRRGGRRYEKWEHKNNDKYLFKTSAYDVQRKILITSVSFVIES